MFDMDFLVPLEYADFSGLKSRSSCSFVVCLAVKQERKDLASSKNSEFRQNKLI